MFRPETGEYLNQAINAQTPWSMRGEGRYLGSQFSKPESNEFQLIIIMTQKHRDWSDQIRIIGWSIQY